jgi:hypothetical protein
MFRVVSIFFIVFAAVGVSLAQIPSHVPGWPYIANTMGFADWAASRIAYNGNEGHLFFNTITGEMDNFFMTGEFSPGWPVIGDTLGFDTTPIILDIDHDGKNEFINEGLNVRGENRCELLYLIDDDGSVMNGFPRTFQESFRINAADLDDDNEYEIIVFDIRGDLLYCLDRFGNDKPGWPISLHIPGSEQGYTPRTGPIGDLDLDGNNEYLICGVWGIYAFRFDGTTQPGFPILLDTSYYYDNGHLPASLADLDHDGYPEIMTAGDNWEAGRQDFNCFVAVYNHDGTTRSGWPIYFQRAWINNAVTPSDINGDGQIEIGYQTKDSLFFTNVNHELLPGWPAVVRNYEGRPRGIYSDLVVVDVNGDRKCEIFSDYNLVGINSYLYAIDYMGNPLPGYPIRTRGGYLGRPPTFAIDKTMNKAYMALISDMTPIFDTISIELFIFPDSTGPANQWPMLSHDNLMTRNYNFVDRVTAIADDTPPPLPKSAILKQNYPNPFNFSTMIEFSLPKEEHFTMSLYDILGRKILDIYDDTFPAGNYRHRLSMDLPSGIYLLALNTDDTHITRKMVLLK